MKKVSNIETISGTATIGLDLSDQTIQFCELAEDGSVAASGNFRFTRTELRKRFATRQPARIALEVCGQSAWVKEALEGFGHEVIVANARELRSITGSSRKSDRRDAEQLARLARVDTRLLKPVTLRSTSRQLDLVLIRSRALLVECRTRLVNGARGMAKLFGERIPSAATKGMAARAREALSPALGQVLSVLLEEIERLSAAIGQCDGRIEAEAARRFEDTGWLTQVGGVGSLTALTYVLTVDSPERFEHSRDVGAFLGFVPRRKQSGEQDPHLGISKCGDRYLRKLLVQCAHHILGRFGADSALRRWGLQHAQAGRASKKKAIVAVARKLAVLLHRLWKRKEVYQPFPLAQPAALACA